MAEKLVNLSKSNSGGGLKKASGNSATDKWSDAYAKAKSVIIAVFNGMAGTSAIAVSITIPKLEVLATSKIFVGGTFYNSSNYYHSQINVRSSGLDQEGLYINGSPVTHTIEFYYN